MVEDKRPIENEGYNNKGKSQPKKPRTEEQKKRNKYLRLERKRGFGLYKTNLNTKKQQILKLKLLRIELKINKLKTKQLKMVKKAVERLKNG